MFAVPVDEPDELLFEAVAPEADLALFGAVDPVFTALSRPDPLGPHVAEQAVGEEPELVGPVWIDPHGDLLGPVAFAAQRDPVVAGLELGVDRPAWA